MSVEPNNPDATDELLDSTTKIPKNELFIKDTVDFGRFIFTFINFGINIVFSFILLVNAFQMDTIKGRQVFVADRVLQSFEQQPPSEIDAFIKTVYGLDAEVLQMIDKTNLTLPLVMPSMYEISGSNSVLRLDSVHCNFMLFSALWIASAFSLAMVHFPGTEPLHWNTIRVLIVHVWNLLGLIFTVVIFSATTKWGSIPASNLFYALVGQVMAWMYQYFHMVECTQVHIGTLQLVSKKVTAKNETENDKRFFNVRIQQMFSSEIRKILYMEFSVVVPMLLVAGIMPGSSGIDEWRVQTVLFSSWSLFALLGLHMRYRKTIQDGHTLLYVTSDDSSAPEDGLDALGYLMYAILMVFVMLMNAIGSEIYQETSYTTDRIRLCRWGVRLLVAVSGSLVIETLIRTIKIRFWQHKKKEDQDDAIKVVDPYWMLAPFIANVLILGFGSFFVNILMFSGISDVNELSMWYK